MNRAALLAVFQVAMLLGWAGYHERVRATAPTFRIPLAPRDPYDVLRGRYFVLNPRDGQLKTGEPDTVLTSAAVETFLAGETTFDGPALVGFCPYRDVHRVCSLQRLENGRPRDGLWARGDVNVSAEATEDRDGKAAPDLGWRVTIDLDLDRFFLPDALVLPGRDTDPGWELEVSHRRGLPLLARRLWFKGRPVDTGQ